MGEVYRRGRTQGATTWLGDLGREREPSGVGFKKGEAGRYRIRPARKVVFVGTCRPLSEACGPTLGSGARMLPQPVHPRALTPADTRHSDLLPRQVHGVTLYTI